MKLQGYGMRISKEVNSFKDTEITSLKESKDKRESKKKRNS